MKMPMPATMRAVKVFGHHKTLYVDVSKWRCGQCTDGVSFEFDGEGGWVIPLDELRSIVREAEIRREEQHAAACRGEK